MEGAVAFGAGIDDQSCIDEFPDHDGDTGFVKGDEFLQFLLGDPVKGVDLVEIRNGIEFDRTAFEVFIGNEIDALVYFSGYEYHQFEVFVIFHKGRSVHGNSRGI